MKKKENQMQMTLKSSDVKMIVDAPMPVRCPSCHGSHTVIDGGVHINKQTLHRFEYRTCKSCAYKFIAQRRLLEDEKD